jgi:hypothetical protein
MNEAVIVNQIYLIFNNVPIFVVDSVNENKKENKKK